MVSQIPDLDKIYEQYLPELGVFLEIGAYDGVTHSNTFMLASKGWVGTYVEPIKEYYEKCKHNHTLHDNVTVVNLAVSDKAGMVTMQKCGELSSISKETVDFVARHRMPWADEMGVRKPESEEVSCVRLNSLLGMMQVHHVDLMVIDAENHEWEILKDFDFNLCSVTMFIIELHEQKSWWHDLPLQIEIINNVNNLMEQNGYTKIFSDDINTIYVKQ
jgi:FkbM family methyltransferase